MVICQKKTTYPVHFTGRVFTKLFFKYKRAYTELLLFVLNFLKVILYNLATDCKKIGEYQEY